ncbi:unnamed protein product, partial [Darwinula stevensoni]
MQHEFEPLPHRDRKIDKIVIHEGFNKRQMFNDYAVLILDFPVELDDHIDTVCLPGPRTNFVGRRCHVSGWGKSQLEEGRHQAALRKIELQMVERARCQDKLMEAEFCPSFVLHPSFLCAGGELAKGVCKGDGGSPLVCLDPLTNHYVQAGIVSWGIGCGERNVPGVYADVAKASDWIEEVLSTHLACLQPDWSNEVPGPVIIY